MSFKPKFLKFFGNVGAEIKKTLTAYKEELDVVTKWAETANLDVEAEKLRTKKG